MLDLIERHNAEREEIEEYLDRLGRDIAAENGNPIPPEAFIDSWELWGEVSLKGPHISITFQESLPGDWRNYHVTIPLNRIKGEE